jgi:hypothetical protein
MIWSKQYFYYDVPEWLNGDPSQPPPPVGRRHGRNYEWKHLNNADIVSMPDKWEYPWYAAWDLAFHTVASIGKVVAAASSPSGTHDRGDTVATEGVPP